VVLVAEWALLTTTKISLLERVVRGTVVEEAALVVVMAFEMTYSDILTNF